jgi:hypothetical protein
VYAWQVWSFHVLSIGSHDKASVVKSHYLAFFPTDEVETIYLYLLTWLDISPLTDEAMRPSPFYVTD